MASSNDCGNSTRGQLQFNLSANDVELLVNFPSSSDPAGGNVFFRIFSGADSGYIPATEAVFHAGWGGVLAPVENFALNLAESPNDGDDAFGPWGGIDSGGSPVATGNFTTASLAEWAVTLTPVCGGGPRCGPQLFSTGMSRSSTGQSGSLTESSALKDLIGPKLYSFGAISAAASISLVPCGDAFGYAGSAKDSNGQDLANATFSWDCTADDGHTVTLTPDPADPSGATGTGSVPRNADGSAHEITCTLTVADPDSGCTDDATATGTVLASLDAILVTPPPLQTLSCTVPSNPVPFPGNPNPNPGNFASGITFSPTISGGSGNYTLAWTLVGTSATCAVNAPTCTVLLPAGNDCATVAVRLIVTDASPTCVPREFEFGWIRKETVIHFNTRPLPPAPPPPFCQ